MSLRPLTRNENALDPPRPGLAPAAALAELHYAELYDPRGLDARGRARGEELLRALREELGRRRSSGL